LAKEREAMAATERAICLVEQEARLTKDNQLQAEQVDEVLRKMQERAIKKASLTPIRSPRSTPTTPHFKPVTVVPLGLGGGLGGGDLGAESKRKASLGAAPESCPRAKRQSPEPVYK